MNQIRYLSIPLYASLVWCSFLVACSTGPRYADFPEREALRYSFTQPGEHRLSDYVSVTVRSPLSGPDIMKFYYHPAGKSDGSKQLIGVILAPRLFTNWDYGDRHNAFGFSRDGKTLLYFHDSQYAKGKLDKRDGLYVFTHPSGDQIIYPDVRHGIYFNPKFHEMLPPHTVLFNKTKDVNDSDLVARTTDGQEFIYETKERCKDGPGPAITKQHNFRTGQLGNV